MAKGSNPLTSKSNSSIGSQGSNKKVSTGWRNIAIKPGGALKSPKAKASNSIPQNPQQTKPNTIAIVPKSETPAPAVVTPPTEEKPKPRELSFVLSALRDSINEQEEKERQKKLGKVEEEENVDDDDDDDDGELPAFPTPPIPSLDESQFVVQEQSQPETKAEEASENAKADNVEDNKADEKVAETTQAEPEVKSEEKADATTVAVASDENDEPATAAAATAIAIATASAAINEDEASKTEVNEKKDIVDPTPTQVTQADAPEKVEEQENEAVVTSEPKTGAADVSEPSSPVPDAISEESPANNTVEALIGNPVHVSDHAPTTHASVIPASSADAFDGVIAGVENGKDHSLEEHNMAEFMNPPTPGIEPSHADQQFRREIEDATFEHEGSSSTTFALKPIDLKAVRPNFLNPREQEDYDADMHTAMSLFFNNKFMKAKALFETKANDDPLYALGLGAMAFIKAIMTFSDTDMRIAMDTLNQAARFANAQIEAAQAKKPFKDTVSHYFSNLMGSNPTGMPTNTPPLSKEEKNTNSSFISNGALRAHVIKAECCLLNAILQLCSENLVGYLKVGLNLRAAYNSYSLVWQEYKKMGQSFNDHMDRDTISAIQFGIGSVHLLLSSLPPKILKVVAAFGWRADKHLGFALLKLCLEGRRIRSPLASMMLLAYYSILTSFAPQILAAEFTQPAIECLLDAQQNYPNSAFFLYFAGRVSRLAKNLPLSTQSFVYASEISIGEWAEVEVRHLTDYESGFNYAMELDWATAGEIFEQLYEENYWSPAFCKYFSATCMDLLGHRTEAILAFADVSKLANKKNTSAEQYVLRKVEQFQLSGYQDMDFSIPALEILLIWNCFPHMSSENLEQCLSAVDSALSRIYEREKQEYDLRMRELAPNQTPPNYFDQRGVLLLVKSSLQNALGKYRESIVHLNWIIDHREMIKEDAWVVPYAYWEAGVTTWGLGQNAKSRKLWETGLSYSKFEFEYRLAVRINLALNLCDEMGIVHVERPKPSRGLSTGGRKRMSIQR